MSMDTNTILRVRDLTITYKEKKILDKINLDIKRGEMYSIIGPNGCGKTTLMKAISRSIKPNGGQVLLYEKNIFQMKTKDVAKKMAVLSQNNNTLSDVTVKELVGYGRYAHKDWWKGMTGEDIQVVDWAIEETNLKNFEHRKINTLSGGERQRAWIAMAIAQEPEVLLLDEPTTYLDISHQLEIMELISKINEEQGITIIMVLHDINHAARYSDELIVIKDQRIFEKGDPWTILGGNVLRDVFRVKAEISTDKDTNKPIYYAKKVI